MKEQTIMRLTAINPIVFFMMPIFFMLVTFYIVWGDWQVIIINLTMLFTIFVSYNIATFEIRVREEDQGWFKTRQKGTKGIVETSKEDLEYKKLTEVQ